MDYDLDERISKYMDVTSKTPLLFDSEGASFSSNQESGFFYTILSNRHSDGTNFCFLDGHAEWISDPQNASDEVLYWRDP